MRYNQMVNPTTVRTKNIVQRFTRSSLISGIAFALLMAGTAAHADSAWGPGTTPKSKTAPAQQKTAPSTGTSPNSSAPPQVPAGNMEDMARQLRSDPESMALMEKLRNDPAMQKILSDPELLRAVQQGDMGRVARDPNVQALEKNPDLQKLLQKNR